MYLKVKIKNEIKNKLVMLLKVLDVDISGYIDNCLLEICYEDLKAFSSKDPSSNNDMLYILNSYLSYYAVLGYRFANYILPNLKDIARELSEHIKKSTGIEIHPSSKIGKRFIIDHGIGTVIGETVIIGDDCYILQSVTLGSSFISNNKYEQRHPIIGNNVQIGGFAKIFGRIIIGDNVTISPGAVIKKSIPNDSRVIVGSNYQVVRNTLAYNIKFTGYFFTKNKMFLFFSGDNFRKFKSIDVFVKDITEKIVIIKNCLIINSQKNNENLSVLFNKDYEMIININ